MFIFAVVKFTVAEVELLQMWTAKGDDGKCTSVKLFYVNKRQTDMGSGGTMCILSLTRPRKEPHSVLC